MDQQNASEEQSNQIPNVSSSQRNESIQEQILELDDQIQEEQYFQTSTLPQNPQLSKFLKEKQIIPYNKYCIDCKKNQTTHYLIWLGAYVCESCAQNHLILFEGSHQTYIKNIFKDQWDDYQLRSVHFGGNKPLFEIFKEYGMESKSQAEKYNHPCAIYYKRRLVGKMDGVEFNGPKPPKDWEQRKKLTLDQLQDAGLTIKTNLKVLSGSLKEQSSTASVVIANKSTELKQKIVDYQIGQKIKSLFSRKRENPVMEEENQQIPSDNSEEVKEENEKKDQQLK